MKKQTHDDNLKMELLEPRRVLSLIFAIGEDLDGFDSSAVDVDHGHVDGFHSGEHHNPGHGGGPGGGGPPSGPAIDLPTVAAHEFGHSLGLGHSSHPDCGTAAQPLMCPFYIGPKFQLEAEDIAIIQSLYPGGGSGTWSDPNITYSFTPDNSRMDQGGKSKLFATMNEAFGSEAVWQQIFAEALDLWAAAEPALSFNEVSDDGSKFNANGATQGDPNFGDIRIAAHKFDGASGTLAHAFFPPPNGATAAGDAHFDKDENWQDLRGARPFGGNPGGDPGGDGDFTLAHDFVSTPIADVGLAFVSQAEIAPIVEPVEMTPISQQIWQDPEASVFELGFDVQHEALNNTSVFNVEDFNDRDPIELNNSESAQVFEPTVIVDELEQF